jgi:prepilin-type N-terminal cleavage/methylation domain-containing protein
VYKNPSAISSTDSTLKNMKLIKRLTAFTLIELLVVISIIAILASLALPAITGALVRGQMTQQLSNMKQLHLVAQQIALDGQTSGDTNLAWPGDLPKKEWAEWANIVTGGGYMTLADFAKMCSAPPITATTNKAVSGVAGTDRAVLGYQASETNDSAVVIFSSSNFTNDSKPVAPVDSGKPFGNKGFVVFRKGGDGLILKVNQATSTNIIGGYVPVLK